MTKRYTNFTILRNVFLYFIIVSFFVSNSIIGKWKEVSFNDSKILKGPYFYKNHFFFLDQFNKFNKYNLSGFKIFEIQLPQSKILDIHYSFDRFFVLDAQGRISSYDVDYGFRNWGPLDFDATQFMVAYPMGVILDRSGNLQAFDFFQAKSVGSSLILSMYSYIRFQMEHLFFSRINKLFVF